MILSSKLFKAYFKYIQFSLGTLGGFFYILIYLLSLLFKPLKSVINDYKEGKLIYSTLVMTILSTLILFLIPFYSQAEMPFKESAIVFLLSILFVSLLVFVSLEMFAAYRKYRIK